MSKVIFGLGILLAVLSIWLMIDLYDETLDFRDIRNRYEESQMINQ